MEVKPNYSSLEGVFSENTLFSVPKYQRAYSWEKSDVEQFCEDIKYCYQQKKEKNKISHHFLGGIVCVKEKNEDELDDKIMYQLVDGQQRLSTTVILIARIVHLLDNIKLSDTLSKLRNRRTNNYLNKYVRLLSEENNEEKYYPRLTLSLRDMDYFNECVKNNEIKNSRVKSHQLIKKSILIIDKFLKFFKEKEDEKTLYNFDLLYRIIGKSCQILILKMIDVSDAYRLFQVINDRGRSLTAGDLLRASSLGLADRNALDDKILKKLESYWDEITSNGSKATDDKLIAYYIFKQGKSCRKISLFENFNSAFFNEPKNIEKELVNLKNGIDLYTKIDDGLWPYSSSKLTTYQQRKLYNIVVTFKHKHCLPLLMAATNLKEKKFYQLIFFLEKFFFIFKVCLQKRMTKVTNIYLKNISKINNNNNTYQVKWFINDLKEVLGDIRKNEFRLFLDDLQYQEKGDNRSIKFLLSSVEESWKWLEGKKSSALDMYKLHSKSLSSDSFIYTIEHIYSNNSMEKYELEYYKNNLPNLTLLDESDNGECANKTFDDKKKIYKKSKINMTIKIADKNNNWEKKQFDKRKNSLYNQLESIFFFGVS